MASSLLTTGQEISSVEEFTNRLRGFILKHCKDALKSVLLSKSGPRDHHGLEFDYGLLADKDCELFYQLLENPKQWFRAAEDAMVADAGAYVEAQEQLIPSLTPAEAQEMPLPKELLHVRVKGLPYAYEPGSAPQGPVDSAWAFFHPAISCLTADHQGKLVYMAGTVVKSRAVLMAKSQVTFKCDRCEMLHPVRCRLEEGFAEEEPDLCTGTYKGCPCRCQKFTKDDSLTVYSPFQEIRIQDKDRSYSGGTVPSTLTVLLQDDLADKALPGDEVRATGILQAHYLRPLELNKPVDADWALVCHNLQVNSRRSNALTDVPPAMSDSFMAHWAAFADRPLLGRNMILQAVCPQIYGMFLVKLATALSLIGGVRQHEAGVRGDIHLLMIGDPGIGKSQVMKFASLAAARCVTVSGRGASAAGLTAAAVKDGKNWSLEAGALVLADGGVCCIDEFDGIRGADRPTLHEAMEQQTVHISKADIRTHLNTRTTIIAAVNPKPAWTTDKPVSQATKLSGPLLSRFDIILILKDTRNNKWDDLVAWRILHNHEQGAQEVQRRQAGDVSLFQPVLPDHQQQVEDDSMVEGSEVPGAGGVKEEWDLERLRYYLLWVKANFHPTLTQEAKDVLQAYFLQLRHHWEDRDPARTTTRMLESLVRISQAHAKLCARNEVTRQDAIIAVQVVDTSVCCLRLVPIDHVIFSDFHDSPDAEYVAQEVQVLTRLGLERLIPAQQPPAGGQAAAGGHGPATRPPSAHPRPWNAAGRASAPSDLARRGDANISAGPAAGQQRRGSSSEGSLAAKQPLKTRGDCHRPDAGLGPSGILHGGRGGVVVQSQEAPSNSLARGRGARLEEQPNNVATGAGGDAGLREERAVLAELDINTLFHYEQQQQDGVDTGRCDQQGGMGAGKKPGAPDQCGGPAAKRHRLEQDASGVSGGGGGGSGLALHGGAPSQHERGGDTHNGSMWGEGGSRAVGGNASAQSDGSGSDPMDALYDNPGQPYFLTQPELLRRREGGGSGAGKGGGQPVMQQQQASQAPGDSVRPLAQPYAPILHPPSKQPSQGVPCSQQGQQQQQRQQQGLSLTTQQPVAPTSQWQHHQQAGLCASTQLLQNPACGARSGGGGDNSGPSIASLRPSGGVSAPFQALRLSGATGVRMRSMRSQAVWGQDDDDDNDIDL